jgi:concanavalin A-like lectin/glucanase superfamily protein
MKYLFFHFLYLFCFLLVISGCDKNDLEQKDSLKDGLLAYYPFNANAKDESGHNYHLTNMGASLTIDRNGKANNAYYFNRDNSTYMVAETSQNMMFSNKLTISLWMKPDAGASDLALIGKFNVDNATGLSFNLGWEDVFSHFQWGLSSAINTGQAACDQNWNDVNVVDGIKTGTFPDGQWSFLALVYDGNKVNVYKNGESIYSTNYTGNIVNCESGLLYIGRWWLNDASYFKGALDEISIYNRALSPKEIKELYKLK